MARKKASRKKATKKASRKKAAPRKASTKKSSKKASKKAAAASSKRSPVTPELSRREREIMNALYRLSEGTATQVSEELGHSTPYHSIRVTLSILERKGHLKRRKEEYRNYYSPVVALSRAKKVALSKVLDTYFAGEKGGAILTLLEMPPKTIPAKEADEILRKVRAAKGK